MNLFLNLFDALQTPSNKKMVKNKAIVENIPKNENSSNTSKKKNINKPKKTIIVGLKKPILIFKFIKRLFCSYDYITLILLIRVHYLQHHVLMFLIFYGTT